MRRGKGRQRRGEEIGITLQPPEKIGLSRLRKKNSGRPVRVGRKVFNKVTLKGSIMKRDNRASEFKTFYGTYNLCQELKGRRVGESRGA